MRAVAIAALTVGCYQPTIATEVPCGADGSCPTGQRCDDNHQPPICIGPDTPFTPDAPPPPLETCGDTSGLQANAPWPLVHGCPTNSGRSRFLGPLTGATRVPPTGTNQNRRGAVVGANNQIIVQEIGAGVVSQFDGTSGAAGWEYLGMGGSGVEPCPVIDDQGLIHATTNYGKMFIIELASGTSPQNLQFSGAYSAPIIAGPGTVYFGSIGPWGFYAIDTVARTQKWHYDVPNMGDARTAPAVGTTMVYFADTKLSRLYALDLATGEHRFDVPVAGEATGSPVLGVDILYVATKTNGLAAFDAQTLALKWQVPVGIGVVQPALLSNGDVVSSTIDGSAFALDRETGDRRDLAVLGGDVLSPPVIDDADTIYFATKLGTLAISSEGAVRWRSDLVGPIVLGDGIVVVMPGTNTLAVIGD